jgi:hypothetical protein
VQSGISSATIYRNVLPPSLRQKKVSEEKRWYGYRDETARIQVLSKPTGVRKVKKICGY